MRRVCWWPGQAGPWGPLGAVTGYRRRRWGRDADVFEETKSAWPSMAPGRDRSLMGSGRRAPDPGGMRRAKAGPDAGARWASSRAAQEEVLSRDPCRPGPRDVTRVALGP